MYDEFDERIPGTLNCTEFALEVSVLSVAEPENFVNCRAARIPSSADVAALLGERGRVHFSEDVLLDVEHRFKPQSS